MKDYREQARKNGVVLINNGPCQFCGAPVTGGIDECMRLFAEVCGREFSDPDRGRVHLLTVDAHALQHSEIHAALNNPFHLLRLFLILEEGTSPSVATPYPLLGALFKDKSAWPPLTQPAPLQRGNVSIVEVFQARDAAEHQSRVKSYAASVFDAWAGHHEWAIEALKTLRKDTRAGK